MIQVLLLFAFMMILFRVGSAAFTRSQTPQSGTPRTGFPTTNWPRTGGPDAGWPRGAWPDVSGQRGDEAPDRRGTQEPDDYEGRQAPGDLEGQQGAEDPEGRSMMDAGPGLSRAGTVPGEAFDLGQRVSAESLEPTIAAGALLVTRDDVARAVVGAELLGRPRAMRPWRPAGH